MLLIKEIGGLFLWKLTECKFSYWNRNRWKSKDVGFYLNSILDDSKTVCVGPEGLIIIKENHKLFVKGHWFQDFEKYIRNSPLPATARHDDGGYWKSLIVKTNESSDLMGIIIMNSQDLTKDQLEDEKNKLREHFETSGLDYNLKSLYFHTWNGIEKMPYDLLFGEPYIIEEFDRFKLRISPESYLLANTYAARIIHDSLKKFCRVYESTTLLDISCGTGPISFSFSPHVKKCIGIDSCFQSIADAKYNAELNKEESVTFIHGNVEMVLPEIFEDNRDDLVAVINSSRTELNKTTFKFLRKCKHLKKIIFISTKPDVDIANFERLCRPAGKESYLGKYFVPLLAIPVDMFPQTKQYGLIMMFQRL
ncbi:tRNA-methyltransferase [Caerostris extrusa]|uniref:tRNA (uracil(54)-C(5))-methyltransferase n=1 Tax=Caerostris extrusa TaxID=172846 RepID=A0AAV4NGV2_CAEEX|nr:tRNA-methyltransferase [Caerostris extrusa]